MSLCEVKKSCLWRIIKFWVIIDERASVVALEIVQLG